MKKQKMKMSQTQEKIKKLFHMLQPDMQFSTIKDLSNNINASSYMHALANSSQKSCPDCASEHIVRFGFYKGKQRYMCKACEKTFGTFTGTPVYYIKKKPKWASFVNMTLEGKSIRAISKELGLSTATAFNWRHKLLGSLQQMFDDSFQGIVEMDDIYFPLSQKGRKKNKEYSGAKGSRMTMIDEEKRAFGDTSATEGKRPKKAKRQRGISNQQVAVMVTMDRYKATDMRTIKLGRPTGRALLEKMPNYRFNQDNIVCSDSHQGIRAYVRDLNLDLQHETFNAGKGEFVNQNSKIYHVQRVNQTAADFRRWLGSRYIGVATKYLQNYLCCYRVMKALKTEGGEEPETLKMLQHSMKNLGAFEYNRKAAYEERYQVFLRSR